jgi:alginate O-acetyltransferase complex protein AlgJ
MASPQRVRELPVGHDEPRRPTRSLPSYKEPTPETHRKLTREDEAEIALKRTTFTPGTRTALVSLFLLTLALVPLIQIAVEIRTRNFTTARTLRAMFPQNGLPRGKDLKAAEKTIETDSVASQWLLPPAQSLLTGRLGAGNEQVYLGRDGWLFYRADVDYVIGPGFLAPARLRQRGHAASVQPDPVKAIVHFRDQLAARGVDLIVAPIPAKTAIDGEMLSERASTSAPLQNASFEEFTSRLRAQGVRVFGSANLLLEQKKARSAPQYLETDSHWRPEAMEFVASKLAEFAGTSGDTQLEISEQQVAAVGDIAQMLKLPADQTLFRPQRVTIHQVTRGDGLWRADRDAEVLLLGDSFTNIFSLDSMGWGGSAGFAEHLSRALGHPLDCIVRNSDGAFATREMLAHELARGRDRLAGKKLVIWEFAARELAFGDWKLIDLKLGRSRPARFFTPQAGEVIDATATVEAVASVPRPATAPYKDHIMSIHLSDLRIAGRAGEPLEALVYTWSMRDNVWTPAARLRPGDRVSLRLRAWSEVAPQLEQINRSEIDDAAIQLEEPVWGELQFPRSGVE